MEVTLTSFRAGRMSFVNGMLNPDPRKGLLKLSKSDDDLTHVQWFERGADGKAITDTPEEDIVVFPGECVMEQLTMGRFLLLKFPEDGDRNLFFWIQEPTVDQDAARLQKFNDGLNGAGDMDVTPAEPAPAPAQAYTSASSGAQGQPDLAALLGATLAGMVPNQGGSADAGALGQNLLARMFAQQGGQGPGGMMRADTGPSLPDVLSSEQLLELFRMPGMLERLAPHLPDEHRNQEALEALATSPQFRQQMDSFGGALQSGQLDLAQLGLPPARGFSIADFLQAVQEDVDRDKKRKQKSQ